jgi:hypothetical protein
MPQYLSPAAIVPAASIAPANLVRLQLLAGVFGFFCLALAGRIEFAFALLYGVALMLANAAWLAHRLEKSASLDAAAGLRSLYMGAAVRFLALLAGLLLAYGLNLHLLVVASGMFLAQAIVFACAMTGFMKDQKENKGDGLG